ncbi:MAG: hypothetical protein ACXWV2_08995, partial [Chitinophagaceae bacterium]
GSEKRRIKGEVTRAVCPSIRLPLSLSRGKDDDTRITAIIDILPAPKPFIIYRLINGLVLIS